MGELYTLPKLPYAFNALEPYISAQQLQIHYEKHHASYIKGANELLEKLDKARKENADVDMKGLLKSLSFNIGGLLLHSLFWENLKKDGGAPKGEIAKLIDAEFGSFDRFKKEFSLAAASVEGSGWAALTYCTKTKRPIIMQIEKHNVNVYPMFRILMVLDVFEHAYYLDYKNDRAKFIEGFWDNINWDKVEERFKR